MSTRTRALIVAAVVAALSGGACTCNKAQAVRRAGPALDVTPEPGDDGSRVLDFGKVRVASLSRKTIDLANVGTATVNIAFVVDPAGSKDLNLLGARALSVEAGATVSLEVRYVPSKVGPATSKVTLTTNDEQNPVVEVLLKGEGVTSALVLCKEEPAEQCNDTLPANTDLALDFGTAQLGQKVTHTLVAKAVGSADVKLARLGFAAGTSGEYSLSPAPPASLAAGTAMTFTVTYTPRFGGPSPGHVEALSDDAAHPRQLVDLTGQGNAPRLCVDSPAVNFGNVAVATTKLQDFALHSCGLLPLTVSALTFTGSEFAYGPAGAPSLPATLAPGEALALHLAFTPPSPGPFSRLLRVASNDPAHPVGAISLLGAGVECTLSVAPSSVDFGQVSTSGSATRQLVLRSTGHSACTVSALAGPTGSPGFAVVSPPSLPLVIPAGGQQSLTLTCTPAAMGAASATLEVDSDDATHAQLPVPLTAEGIAPPPCDFVAVPTSIAFGTTNVGATAAQTVTVTNHGTSECYVTGGGTTGSNAFSAALPSGFGGASTTTGQSFAVPVKYAPTSVANDVGVLEIDYGDMPVMFPFGGGNYGKLLVPLSGGTATPKLCVTPALLDFGSQPSGTSVTRSFTITSCGAGTLTVRGVQLAPGSSKEFALAAPAVPLVLQPSQSAAVAVTYGPATTSGSLGRALVLSNDPASPKAPVDLRGNITSVCGTQLACSPPSVTLATTAVGRATSQSITCLNAGTSPVTVTGVTEGAGGSADISASAGALPATVQPGDALRVELTFTPTSASANVASFTIDGECNPVTIDAMALGAGANYPPCPGVQTFNPKTKWQWNGGNTQSASNMVTMTPAVVNLDDDNGDGKIDENDGPDVVFASCSTSSCCPGCFDVMHQENSDLSGVAILRAISGKDAHELWSLTDPNLAVPAGSQIAVGDLDGDGVPEIVAVKHSFQPGVACPGVPGGGGLPMCGKYTKGTLLVLSNAGKLLFETEPWSQPIDMVESDGAPLLADLAQTGFPNIIWGDTVYDSTGHVLWHMTGQIGSTGHGAFPAAADVDGDGKLELLAGGTAYRADGSILWKASGVGDGIDLVADVDGDGKPEVIVRTAASTLYILEGATGAVKRKIDFPVGDPKMDPSVVSDSACPAGPSAADFEGTGKMDIALPAGNWFFLIRGDTGEVVWQKPIEDWDGQCGSSGAAVFSFFGDGKTDVVYHDTAHVYVWRGDGTQVYLAPRTSSTLLETPVIADIDNDGHADLLITNEGLLGTGAGLTALDDEQNLWPSTRRVWTQWNYHVTDANENGTIPRLERPLWTPAGGRMWRGNPSLCTR